MAIDTRNKRSSAIHVGLPWRGMLPAPDGAIDQADRQHACLAYAGILAEEEVEIILPARPAVTRQRLPIHARNGLRGYVPARYL